LTVGFGLHPADGCGQIARICGIMSTTLRLDAGVDKPTNPHCIAFNAFTLLVKHIKHEQDTIDKILPG